MSLLGAVALGPWGLLGLYVRVVLSIFKPRWSPKLETAQLPEMEVAFSAPLVISSSILEWFKVLAGWPADKVVKAEPAGLSPSASSEITPEVQPHVPVVFLISQTFRLAMGIMFSHQFPYRVLGCVVNRRARYTMFRGVTTGDTLDHSCKLNPVTRNTPGGHLEFDMVISSRLASTDELVWTATLTLVLLNPGGRRPRPKEQAAAAPSTAPEEAAERQQLSVLKALQLKDDAGRRYAMLDGDISPMHLWAWTARLVGFPRPVGNVHLVMAMVEAALAEAAGTDGLLPVPATLEAEFKSPVLLPAKLQIRTPVVEQGKDPHLDLARLAHSPHGLSFTLFSTRPARSMAVQGQEEEEEVGKEVLVGKLLLRVPHDVPAH